MLASQAPYAIQPRVFDERFPHLVLYVQDVEAAATRWRGVFLASTGPAGTTDVTIAEGAQVVAGADNNRSSCIWAAGVRMSTTRAIRGGIT